MEKVQTSPRNFIFQAVLNKFWTAVWESEKLLFSFRVKLCFILATLHNSYLFLCFKINVLCQNSCMGVFMDARFFTAVALFNQLGHITYRYSLFSKFEAHLLEMAPSFFFFSYYFRETEEACAHAYMHKIIWQNLLWTQLFQVHNLYNVHVFWETLDVKHFWRPLGQLLGLLGYTRGRSEQFSWLAIAFCILHCVLFSGRLTWSVSLLQKNC